jgi:hypothetical protein
MENTRTQAAWQTQNAAPDWDLYRAYREQWTHEDNLVNHRLMWLIMSGGLLFTAYGTQSGGHVKWLIFGFPFFGMAIATLIGVGIFTALSATDELRRQFDSAVLSQLCSLTPVSHSLHRGRWAAQALPFVFGALWLLALANSLWS